MGKIIQDFVTDDNRQYKFKLGHLVASSLSGFFAGLLVASIIWFVALESIKKVFDL